DPISQALRDCLKLARPAPAPYGPPPDLGALAGGLSGLKELEATRAAITLLSGLASPLVGLPNLEELDRRIEFQRLLAQFERMVEPVPQDAQPARNHYFFGREEEMETLRGFVGVIAASSWRGAAKRASQAVSRAIKGRGAMTVWGVGGM